MKKSLLMLLLVCTMVVTMLAGCGKKADNSGAAAEEEITDYGSGEIKIWVAENVAEFTKAKAEQFIKDNEKFSGYTIKVEAVGEGDAASNMITDVQAGADIYGFAQDQLARLVAAGAIAPVPADIASTVSSENDAESVAAATIGDVLYCYPTTSDNGYFLYYDKSVVTDPTSVDAILKDCEAAGKGFYFEINSGWYQTAFFFGTGCTLTYETDTTGAFTACNADYASENGLAALKAMIALHKSPIFNNGSSISNAANVAAIVDGTWDSGAAKDLFGENYACAKLPKITVDGKEYQLGGFSGYKLMGVKPQEEVGKLAVCNALAAYLTSEEVQIDRYNEVGWGPSNKKAQENDVVKADEALSALRDQLPFDMPQGQYPGEYWGLATSLGDSVIAGDYDNATDEELMSVLTTFQDTCASYVSK